MPDQRQLFLTEDPSNAFNVRDLRPESEARFNLDQILIKRPVERVVRTRGGRTNCELIA